MLMLAIMCTVEKSFSIRFVALDQAGALELTHFSKMAPPVTGKSACVIVSYPKLLHRSKERSARVVKGVRA